MTDARELLLAEIQRLQLTLIEARLELEYLEQKFGDPEIGRAVLARIAVVLRIEGNE